MILCVIFVVFMLFWLLGGSYAYWPADRAGVPMFAGGTLLPWLCVAILGWIIFGGDTGSHMVVR